MDNLAAHPLELSTIIILVQTSIEFLLVIFGKTKKTKKNSLGYLAISFLFLGLLLYYVFFINYGFRALFVLMTEQGNMTNTGANILITSTFYLGYFFVKRYMQTLTKNEYKKESNLFLSIFFYSSGGIVSSIFLSFVYIALRNKFL